MRPTASVALALVLALALAGCSAPMGSSWTAGRGQVGPAPVGPANPAPQVRDEVVAGGDFATGPGARQVEIPFRIPNGTVQLLLRVTLEEGAAAWLSVQLSSCSWTLDGPVAAQGETLEWACGAPLQGDDLATLSVGPGLLWGDIHVVAQRCGAPHDERGCFRIPP